MTISNASRLGVAATIALLTVTIPTVASPSAEAAPAHRSVGRSFGPPTTAQITPPARPAVPIAAARAVPKQSPSRSTSTATTANVWQSLVTQQPGANAGSVLTYFGSGSTSADPWRATPEISAAQFGWASRILLADLSGTGRDDLLAIDPTLDNGTMWIYPNTGQSGAARWGTRYFGGNGWNTVDSIQVADVEGTGRADLIARVPGEASGTLYIYPNDGSTTSDPFTSRIWAGTGWNLAKDWFIGDVTGDGNADVLIRNASNQLAVYRGNGSHGGNPWTTAAVSASSLTVPSSNWLVTADVNHDGRLDVLEGTASGAMTIYDNTGVSGAWFDSAHAVAAGVGWNSAQPPVAGDIDGNGALDLATLTWTSGDAVVYPNNHSTTSPPWTTAARIPSLLGGADIVRAGDLRGDGRTDLVIRKPGIDNGELHALLDDGSGSTDPWTTVVDLGTGWDMYTDITLGDIDGHGGSDIVGLDAQGSLWAYPLTWNGTSVTVASRIPIGSGFAGDTVATGDVDGDGYADLIDLRPDGTLWLYLAADPDAGPIQMPGDFSGYTRLAVGQVDGTGHAALIAEDPNGALWIYPSSGVTSGNPYRLGRRGAGTGWNVATALTV